MHKCDNPPCCNPAHLRAGTLEENIADMVSKARNKIGARDPNAKLTDPDVVGIRALLREGFRRRDIAAGYGVAMTTIAAIAIGRTWKHVA
jgi:hypothetical protein